METINNNGVNEPVSYIVYESSMARMERQIKRLFILCVIVFAALIVTNAGWIIYENQYVDSVTETYTADAIDGGNAISIRDGEVSINGESNVQQDKNKNKENP